MVYGYRALPDAMSTLTILLRERLQSTIRSIALCVHGDSVETVGTKRGFNTCIETLLDSMGFLIP